MNTVSSYNGWEMVNNLQSGTLTNFKKLSFQNTLGIETLIALLDNLICMGFTNQENNLLKTFLVIHIFKRIDSKIILI